MNHPLALSAEYKARLQAQGLIVIRKDPEHIENVVKDGPPRKRVKKPSAASLMRLQEKRAQNPPLCSRAGCEAVSKHYCAGTGFVGDYYGKLCPEHADEANRAERAYRERKKALGQLPSGR